MKVKLKKVLAILISFSMIISLIPLQNVKAATTSITNVRFIMTDKSDGTKELNIVMFGSGFTNANMQLITSAGHINTYSNSTAASDGLFSTTIALDKYGRLNGDTIDGNDTILMVNSQQVSINLSNTPYIDQTQSPKVKKIYSGASNTFIGQKFNNLKGSPAVTKLYMNGQELNQSNIDATSTDNTLVINNITGQAGLETMSFETVDTTTNTSIPVTMKRIYENEFSLIENMTGVTDTEVSPNMGTSEQGNTPSTVFNIMGTGFNTNMSVFFENQDNGIVKDYLAASCDTIEQSGNVVGLKVSVPKGINPGIYNILITNKVPDGLSNDAAINYATSQVILKNSAGEEALFNVVSDTDKMKIYQASPSTAMESTDVNITGDYLISSNNIPGISDITNGSVTYSGNKVVYTFNAKYSVNGTVYPVTAEKDIYVKIGGNDPTYTSDLINKDVLGGSSAKDLFNLNINHKVDKDTPADITAETRTTLTRTDDPTKTYQFIDNATLSNQFTFKPSYIVPTITKITPDHAAQDKDVYVCVTGSNFAVYKSDKLDKAKYPKIVIGAYPEETGKSIVINPNTDSSLDFKVLDSNGNVLTGTEALSYTGVKIIFKIPGSMLKLNGKQSVYVVNPLIKDDPPDPVTNEIAYGGYTNPPLKSAFEFINVTGEHPVIKNIDPNIVPTDGGTKDVSITGSRLIKDNSIVTMDGEIIDNAKIDPGSGQLITFKPKAHTKGTTHIQVINADGGTSNIEPFIYTKTSTEPSIDKMAPTMGKVDTLVTLAGKNFILPDMTSTITDPYGLLGTTVLFNNKDINVYNDSFNQAGNNRTMVQYTGGGYVFGIKNNLVDINDDYESTVFQYKTPAGDYKYACLFKDLYSNVGIIDSNGVKHKVTAINSDNSLVFSSDTAADIAATQGQGTLTINGNIYTAYTPYQYTGSGSTMKIIGKRVFIRDYDLNNSVLQFKVPNSVVGLDTATLQDGPVTVSIKNPDTKTADAKDPFIYYSQPRFNPTITALQPAYGNITGGNVIKLVGTDFQDSKILSDRMQVFFGAQQADPNYVKIVDNNTAYVKVPAYPKDFSDVAIVPVTIVNYDGSSATITGYKYVKSKSHPKIQTITPKSGSASGGEQIIILGKDFRDSEPYIDKDGDGKYTAPVQNGYQGDPYEDLNGDGKWTEHATKSADGTYSDLEANLLPQVYFGSEKAQVLDFDYAKSKIICKAPKNLNGGSVDVTVVNPDGGIDVASKGYSYGKSSPKVTSVVPEKGPKTGGKNVTLIGSGFVPEGLQIRFGELTNEAIDSGQTNSGYLDPNGSTTVDLGNLEVSYSRANSQESMTLKFLDKNLSSQPSKTYNISKSKVMYINLGKQATTNDGVTYQGLGVSNYDTENVKIEVTDSRIIVTRGYVASITNAAASEITLKTPPKDTIGKVTIHVINSDGGEDASQQYEYTNPSSTPKITDILKGGESGKLDKVNNQTVKVIHVSSKGGTQLSIVGSGFRDGATVYVGTQEATVISDPITATNILIKLGEGKDLVGKLLKVVVSNSDGGVADSTEVTPPIYVMYDLAESDPTLDATSPITPNKGSVKGGTVVTIKGNNFKSGVKVSFGTNQASIVQYIDYKTLKVTTPSSSTPGPVDVIITNPDAGQITAPNAFTYISSPQITDVDPKEVSVLGGDEVNVKGSGFVDGAIAYVGATLKPYTAPKTTKGQQQQTPTNLVYKDDQAYTIEGGTKIDTTNVEFVDVSTLKVTMPAGKLTDKGLLVVNPDTGVTNIFTGFTYAKPKPQAPKGLKAQIIFNKYIRLTWDEVPKLSDGTDDYYYEVYKVVNGQYYFADISKSNSYLEKNLTPGAQYKFVVKAVKNGNSSDFSDESNAVDVPMTIESSKVQDGPIVPDTNKVTVSPSGDATVNIGTKDANTTIDLTDAKFTTLDKLTINIPASVIKDGTKSFDIMMNGFKITIPSKAFAIDSIMNIQDDILLNNSVGSLNIDFGTGYMEESKIPKGSAVISPIYNIGAQVQIDKDVTILGNLGDKLNMLISYDEDNVRKIEGFKYTPVPCYYDYDEQQWKQIDGAEQDGLKNILTDKTGTFTIIDMRQ